MRVLTAPLEESTEYRKMLDLLKNGRPVLADGCEGSQKLQLVHALCQREGLDTKARYRIILTYDELRAKKLQEEFEFYDRSTVLFPAKDLIFYQADLHSRELEQQRMKCLRRIQEGRPLTVITTMAALLTPQIPAEQLQKNILYLEKGAIVETAALAAKLVAMGYERTAQAQAPGQFSIRGDIADIFDLTAENPCRIELWGDEVESVRLYDPETQRSLQQLESVRIFPASEIILSEGRLESGLRLMEEELEKRVRELRQEDRPEAAHRLENTIRSMAEEAREWKQYGPLESSIHYFYPETETFLGLFPEEFTTIFYDEPEKVGGQSQAVWDEFRESMISRAEGGYILPGQMELLWDPARVHEKCQKFRRVGLTGLLTSAKLFDGADIVSMHSRSVMSYHRSFEVLAEDLRKYKKQRYRILLVFSSRTRARRIAQDLTDVGLTTFYSENPDRILEPGEIMAYYGRVSQGFEYPQLSFVVISDSDIFGAVRKKKKPVKKNYAGEAIREFSELKPGDYVVHEDYGIGIYRGVEKITVEGARKDYLRIEYAGESTLYVLPTELSVLQKYSGAEGTVPKISRMGGKEWTNTKKKVKSAVEEVAEDLVQLYSARLSAEGYAYGPDTVWQREFEELFPYEETQDQLAAIEETKKDMESSRIMDRLICGDVGFGKTEIAIRAAFKAVQDGKQVAILVPTTILAQQHYNNFTERMKNYPVNIGMLSRFRTASEQKKTLKALQGGTLDILIGTHRLLSADVHFRDLGLLIIDEEQRFGVSHKEKIKKLRENVDVLTLSATPIPRTLHMSLVGIRDMSLLEEAPAERVPIQTYVLEYNEEMIREGITRELARGGQVYYVYNRVQDIDQVAAHLQEMIPEARIEFAHGQMNENLLERIMYDFISGEIDVLVSTTIIETGLDISNVNTMIIHDADRMGLSQLYQLRGRIGRSNRIAYAFLMYKKGRMLKETAQERLAAIREFTDLGSGFRISMRDLEIRGAGSVLGKAQHGHMAAVGYDLYCKMLGEAVRNAKGEPQPEETHCRVNLPVDVFLPENYILNENQKLDIYKKIAAIGSLEDCEEMKAELKDRFGDVPAPAANLLRIALIRAVAARLELTDITGGSGRIRFTMNPKANVRVENIPLLIRLYGKSLSFASGKEPAFVLSIPECGVQVRDEENVLSGTEDFLIRLEELLR